MKYDHAPVSTDGPSETTQIVLLIRAGCRKMFGKTAVGAKIDHSQLRKVLAALESWFASATLVIR